MYADEDWKAARRLAPRDVFVPTKALAGQRWIDREADPKGWWDAVRSDAAIVTQVDDGNTELTAEAVINNVDYTSSCSAPKMVFEFLRLLDARPGDKVLEIGTGTGWTAALLSARLGDRNVVTVEIDPAIAARAADNLEKAGFDPQVIVSDGGEGWTPEAPYDRVHVTCGVADVPYSWIEQTREGGFITLPWMHGFNGQKIKLHVTGDGAASGTFHGECGYMMLRSQRDKPHTVHHDERETAASMDPRQVMQPSEGRDIYMAVRLADISGAVAFDNQGWFTAILHSSDSHALVRESRVTQRGPRDLWSEAETAYREWVGFGCPDRDRFGVTVVEQGQHIWLDDPDNRIERR